MYVMSYPISTLESLLLLEWMLQWAGQMSRDLPEGEQLRAY
jgi:hypothetical protein